MLLKYQISFLIFLLLNGCAAVNTSRHNLLPAALKEKPVTQVSHSNEYNFSNYRTFTVLPISTFSDDNKTDSNNDVVQMHLLFTLRNALEGRGYKFVKPSETPDFIATIENFAAKEKNYLATAISSKSKWKTKDVVDSKLDFETEAPLIWGEYHNLMTSSNHQSSSPKTPQGLAVGTYYPQIEVTLFDKKNMSVGWRGTAIGVSHSEATQISAQLIVRSLMSQLQISKHRATNFPLNTGKIGLGYAVITTDGKNYYPAITGLNADTPAKKGGLQNADYIIEINNLATLNKTTGSISNMLSGAEGSKIKLKIWRMGAQSEYTLKRIQR